MARPVAMARSATRREGRQSARSRSRRAMRTRSASSVSGAASRAAASRSAPVSSATSVSWASRRSVAVCSARCAAAWSGRYVSASHSRTAAARARSVTVARRSRRDTSPGEAAEEGIRGWKRGQGKRRARCHVPVRAADEERWLSPSPLLRSAALTGPTPPPYHSGPVADIAQLVERFTRNEQVSSSNLLIGSCKNAPDDALKADFGAFGFDGHSSLPGLY